MQPGAHLPNGGMLCVAALGGKVMKKKGWRWRREELARDVCHTTIRVCVCARVCVRVCVFFLFCLSIWHPFILPFQMISYIVCVFLFDETVCHNCSTTT